MHYRMVRKKLKQTATRFPRFRNTFAHTGLVETQMQRRMKTDNGNQWHMQSKPPWWGGDLQTIRNQLLGAPDPLNSVSRRLEFPVTDGTSDRLTATLETPSACKEKPLLVLIHGLTGDENSRYVYESARYHLGKGSLVLRLNLRGAGSSRQTATGYYFGGCVDDIDAVLTGLDPSLTRNGIVAIGYSLGGNILINALAKSDHARRIRAAATVSAPLRPDLAAKRLMHWRNGFYHRLLLRQMKRAVLSPYAEITDQERDALARVRSIYEFDDVFTAPRNGFTDADDYYRQTAGATFVGELQVPTLLIHARNDPWIPVSTYDELIIRLRQYCPSAVRKAHIAIQASGGHVGFHQRKSSIRWYDEAIDRFFTTIE